VSNFWGSELISLTESAFSEETTTCMEKKSVLGTRNERHWTAKAVASDRYCECSRSRPVFTTLGLESRWEAEMNSSAQ
jgi:hypothetical protein